MQNNLFTFNRWLYFVPCLLLFGWLSFQWQSTNVEATQIPVAMAGRNGQSLADNDVATESLLRQHPRLKANVQKLAYGSVPSRAQITLPSAERALLAERLPVTKRLAPFTRDLSVTGAGDVIGAARAIDLSAKAIRTGTAGFNQTDATGKTMQIIALESPGALELRVHFSEFDLPEGDEVFVYGLGGDSPVYRYTGRGEVGGERVKGGGDFWSGIVTGERVVIEYLRQPDSTGGFTVPALSHFYQSVFGAPQDTNATAQDAPLSCHLDVNCYPNANTLKRGVARIVFQKGDETKSCSGTLLASGPADEFAPYFLTANHCIANAAVAETADVIWRFWSTSCNSKTSVTSLETFVSPRTTLLKTIKNKDQTLLRILGSIPSDAHYAGWSSASWPAGTNLVALHHPRASFMRYSEGQIVDQDEDCSATGLVDGYGIDWDNGLVEKGSSGSAIFHSTNSQVLGVLSCGVDISTCTSVFDTSYGKFSHFYPWIQSYLNFGDRSEANFPVEPSANFSGTYSMGTVPSRVFGEGGQGDPYYGAMFRFQGKAGERIRFTMRSSQVDSHLTLLAPSKHRWLAENDDSGGGATGLDAQINEILPETGIYLLEASTAVSKQTGDFTIIGELVCDYSVEKTSYAMNQTADNLLVKITRATDPTCPVTAKTNVSWLTVGGPIGDNYQFFATANTSGAPRTGRITFSNGLNGTNSKDVFVTQSASCAVKSITLGQEIQESLGNVGDCYAPSATGAERPYADVYQLTASQGNQLSISVNATDQYTATSLKPTIRFRNPTGQLIGEWLNANNTTYARVPANGDFYTIPATGNYTIEVSSNAPVIGNYRIRLITTGCNFNVAAPPASIPAAGQSVSLPVTSNGCLWSTYVPVDWIQRNSPLLTTGNGTVSLTVKPNPGPARSAELLIAEKVVTINQANGCQYSVAPTSKAFPAGGGVGSLLLVALNSECPWTVALTAPSGMISYPVIIGSKKGSDSITYTVNANTGAARIATFTIAGQTHTITQAAVAPNPVPTLTSFTPASATAGDATFRLKLNGSNFLPSSRVILNRTTLDTRILSDTQLEVEIPASAIATAGELGFVINTPAPGGGTTAERKFPVYGGLANVSAASFASIVSPDSIIAVFGTNLARGIEVSRTAPLPTDLLGTTVHLRDRAGRETLAPLFFVSPNQINYLFPSGLATGPIQVTITNGNGQVSLGEITLTATAPALFAANANGQGAPAAVALRVTADGRQIYEPINEFDSATRRWVAKPINLDNEREQVYLILYGSGIRGRTALNQVAANLGRSRYAVGYAGPQGTLTGLDQVNLLLPNQLAGAGEIPLSLIVDGKLTNVMRLTVQ